jgi:branched-chain amino acid transport system substrate-binding protein
LVAANFAFDDLGSKKAAILMDIGSDYSQGLSENFIREYTSRGGEIVAQEAFRSEELDYRAQLGKIRDSGADLLFIPTMQKEAGLAMNQARELGLTCTFLGGDAWASIELIELGGPATEGSFYVNLASLEDPVLADWVADYVEKWGKEPVMPNPVFAVDALLVIVEAIKATESTDSEVLAKYIENMKGVKVLTGNISFDPETHNPIGKSAVIETVKNGEFTFYKGID